MQRVTFDREQLFGAGQANRQEPHTGALEITRDTGQQPLKLAGSTSISLAKHQERLAGAKPLVSDLQRPSRRVRHLSGRHDRFARGPARALRHLHRSKAQAGKPAAQIGVDLRAGNHREPIRQGSGAVLLQDDIEHVGVGVRQMIGKDDDRPVRDQREMLGTSHQRVMLQDRLGERVMNAPRQRIARIVVPGIGAAAESRAQRRQCIGPRIVDRALEMLADAAQVGRVVAREKHRNRLDQRTASARSTCRVESWSVSHRAALSLTCSGA